MINIATIYDTVQAVMNNAQSGSLAPREFNSLCNMAEQELYDALIAEYERTQTISDMLAPFKRESVSQPFNGQFPKPTDYLRFSSFSTVEGANKVMSKFKMVRDDQWAEASTNPFVTYQRRPIVNERDTYFQFLPATEIVCLRYLKKLVPSVYGVTDVDGAPVYNAGTSTNSEFNDLAFPELVYRICMLAGLNLDKNVVLQVMGSKTQQPSIINS